MYLRNPENHGKWFPPHDIMEEQLAFIKKSCFFVADSKVKAAKVMRATILPGKGAFIAGTGISQGTQLVYSGLLYFGVYDEKKMYDLWGKNSTVALPINWMKNVYMVETHETYIIGHPRHWTSFLNTDPTPASMCQASLISSLAIINFNHPVFCFEEAKLCYGTCLTLTYHKPPRLSLQDALKNQAVAANSGQAVAVKKHRLLIPEESERIAAFPAHISEPIRESIRNLQANNKRSGSEAQSLLLNAEPLWAATKKPTEGSWHWAPEDNKTGAANKSHKKKKVVLLAVEEKEEKEVDEERQGNIDAAEISEEEEGVGKKRSLHKNDQTSTKKSSPSSSAPSSSQPSPSGTNLIDLSQNISDSDLHRLCETFGLQKKVDRTKASSTVNYIDISQTLSKQDLETILEKNRETVKQIQTRTEEVPPPIFASAKTSTIISFETFFKQHGYGKLKCEHQEARANDLWTNATNEFPYAPLRDIDKCLAKLLAHVFDDDKPLNPAIKKKKERIFFTWTNSFTHQFKSFCAAHAIARHREFKLLTEEDSASPAWTNTPSTSELNEKSHLTIYVFFGHATFTCWPGSHYVNRKAFADAHCLYPTFCALKEPLRIHP